LSARALNRATLARQLLLHRSDTTAAAALEHLVGLQAQSPTPPYIGLWSRLQRFRTADLSSLIVERKAVRIALMRGTIHLVTSPDCLALRPTLQPVLDRALRTTYGRQLAGLDVDAVAAAGRLLVDERPRTFAELRAALAPEWPDRDPEAVAMVVRHMLPLVQVPPRGIWGARGRSSHTSAEAWLGRPLAAGLGSDELIARYLAAFGPSTIRDIQAWSGLSGLAPFVERLAPRLTRFVDEHGRELLDLSEAPRPGTDTPAPVRFLPEYDNLLLSHADRTRVITDAHRALVFAKNGIVSATVLVDGFVQATWRIARRRDAALLVVEPFDRLPGRQARAVFAEGRRLLRFAAADAALHDVQIVPPGA
jgi:hypothetical protein